MVEIGDPFKGLVPRKLDQGELARAIRLDIADEIEAINMYQAHYDATTDERARRVLAHIIRDEKEHLAEFLELVKILDPEQGEELETAPREVQEIIVGQASDKASPARKLTMPGPGFTVGNLTQAGRD